VLGIMVALGVQFAVKQFSTLAANPNFWKGRSTATARPADPAMQAEAEGLLQRVAAGDTAAADKVLATSDNWTGKTQRSQRADQLMVAALNSRDLPTRAAAVQAELAFGGVHRNAEGLDYLERTARNGQYRGWALWMLGAIGNRGVDPPRVGSIIKTYLDDSNANTRASAADALSILATDDTVPLLLDRFRNDSSPMVQEHAACGLAESGMYTHAQRMIAAATLVTWLDDSNLSPAQREWTLHALRDISGQNLGNDSTAWRRWFESTQ
jgi:HEAT repeat protein